MIKHGEWVFQTFTNKAFPYNSVTCNIPQKDLNYFNPTDKDKSKILLENGFELTYGDNYIEDGENNLMGTYDLKQAWDRLLYLKVRSEDKNIRF